MKARPRTLLILVLLLGLATWQLGCSTGESSASSDDSSSESNDANPAADGGGETGDDADSGKADEDGDEDGEEEDEEEAVPVEVAALEAGEIESVLRFSANLEAEDQIKVYSQAQRLVTELLVEEGDVVRRGQLLLRLQDEEQKSAVAKVKSQLAKAEREYRQQERLFKQDLIAQQDFDNATYELEQLQISLEDAERALTYTRLTAPIGGTITARMINLGDQVQMNQHLFDMVDFESMVARVFVPEKHLDQLRTGLVARISAQAASAPRYESRVDRISPVVDPKSGTVKVTIDVGNRKGLRPGMYVDVDLVTATNEDAVLVPKRAVVYDNDQMFVYRLGDERRVERVFFSPRLADKYFVEPIEGLLTGDQVVVAGQAGLKEGALVSLPGDESEQDEADEDASAEDVGVTRAGL